MSFRKAMREKDTRSGTGEMICEAIKKRQQMQFHYNEKLRIVEPQSYGIGIKGTELLRAYQVNERPPAEKLFDVSKITELVLLDSYFISPGPNYKSHDSGMKEVFCEL